MDDSSLIFWMEWNTLHLHLVKDLNCEQILRKILVLKKKKKKNLDTFLRVEEKWIKGKKLQDTLWLMTWLADLSKSDV